MKRSWGILLLWVATLVFALNTGRDIAFNLLYFVTGVIVVALVWSWANLRGLAVDRSARAQRGQVGKYFEETLELHNRSRWPKLWVEVHDKSDLPGHMVSRVVNGLGSRNLSVWQVRTLCQRRGRYTLGPMVLTSGDPLGIFRFSQTIPTKSSLVITPATVELPGFIQPTGYLPGGEAMRRRTPYITTSVSGVRDYSPGDSFNRIHWPSTARTGRLISKEFELDPLADVWICLDLNGDVHTEAPWMPELDEPLSWVFRHTGDLKLPPSTVEYGITIAASLALHFLRLDREVGFFCYADRREVVQPDRGERQLNRLLEILAVVQARGRIPLGQVLATDGAHLARHTTLIVVTPSTDGSWVSALRGLRARGVQGVAVLIAGNTFGSAPSPGPVVAELQASGLPTYVVKMGDELAEALSHRVGGADRPIAAGWL